MAHSSETPHHFEELTSRHDLASFVCEEDWLNEYLHEHALNDAKRHLSRTFVCIDEGASSHEAVIGYFTIRSSGFNIGTERFVALVEILCLARHVNGKGQDWGNVLLSEALAKAVEVDQLVGVAGVELMSTTQGLKLYQSFGFSGHPISTSKKLYLAVANIPVL